MLDEDRYTALRTAMVAEQIERRGLHEARLLTAMRTVPRHRFVPPNMRAMAYEDGPLPIGNGQTISQPYIVALMTDLLQLNGTENVLEVGTGSGYQAAVLSHMARTVHTIERFSDLADRARQVLADLGYSNVHVHTGDGSLGWPEAAPYHGILVTAAAPVAPPPLLNQLAEGGRLVIPVGERDGQILQVWQRVGEHYESEDLILVTFVPLRGKHGWDEDRWLN